MCLAPGLTSASLRILAAVNATRQLQLPHPSQDAQLQA